MPWVGQVCDWGRCPSARVAERVGGLLPLVEDLPVLPRPKPASVSNSESKFSPSTWAERGFRRLQQGEVPRKRSE